LNCWKIMAQVWRQSRSAAPDSAVTSALAEDAAGGGIVQAVDHAQQRRLAGTGPADDADEGAATDLQRHVGDRRLGAEAPRDPVDGQHERFPFRNERREGRGPACRKRSRPGE
jgi:hypothetical protein